MSRGGLPRPPEKTYKRNFAPQNTVGDADLSVPIILIFFTGCRVVNPCCCSLFLHLVLLAESCAVGRGLAPAVLKCICKTVGEGFHALPHIAYFNWFSRSGTETRPYTVTCILKQTGLNLTRYFALLFLAESF